ncbi:hypothetical protein Droror1_Dr00004386 [Drosera rotundifolia]
MEEQEVEENPSHRLPCAFYAEPPQPRRGDNRAAFPGRSLPRRRLTSASLQSRRLPRRSLAAPPPPRRLLSRREGGNRAWRFSGCDDQVPQFSPATIGDRQSATGGDNPAVLLRID